MIWIGLLALTCALLMVWSMCRAAAEQSAGRDPGTFETVNTMDEIRLIMGRSAWHRERMEADAARLAELHGYESHTCEAETLAEVVYSGRTYSDAMTRVFEMRRKRLRPR